MTFKKGERPKGINQGRDRCRVYPMRTVGFRRFEKLRLAGLPYRRAMAALTDEERDEAREAQRLQTYRFRHRNEPEFLR